MAKKNVISIQRVPDSGDAVCTATISVQFDPGDPEAVECFGRVLRELIPEAEREAFLEDWKAAGAAAGLSA